MTIKLWREHFLHWYQISRIDLLTSITVLLRALILQAILTPSSTEMCSLSHGFESYVRCKLVFQTYFLTFKWCVLNKKSLPMSVKILQKTREWMLCNPYKSGFTSLWLQNNVILLFLNDLIFGIRALLLKRLEIRVFQNVL